MSKSNTIMPRNTQTAVSGETIGDTTYLHVLTSGSPAIPSHDATDLTYNGSNQLTTVEYYSGGLAGTLVATMTLTYDGSGNVDTTVITTP